MATAVVTNFYQEGVIQAAWSGLAANEAGDAADVSKWPTKSIQVSGTPGVGATVTVEGSNDGSSWGALTDSGLTPISFDAAAVTAQAVSDILQNTAHIRPVVTGGDGTTIISVRIVGT